MSSVSLGALPGPGLMRRRLPFPVMRIRALRCDDMSWPNCLDPARRFPTVVLAIATVVVVAGCGESPANANAPGGSVSITVGHSVPYRLYTHCGILSSSINGETYYADPPLSDGSGNPPAGWGNPYTDGDMTLQTVTTAVFDDHAGHTARFTNTPMGPMPSIPICS